jgi:sporulation protein YlmC with PRC-barrel domain
MKIKREATMTTQVTQDQNSLKKDETFALISASKVQGTNVYNTSGERVGDVDDVMIDKATGKIAYAVVTFGGFLGMGKDRYALPWAALKYDTRQDGYVVGVADDVLKSTPAIGDYSDETWRANVYSHFGVSPYWN